MSKRRLFEVLDEMNQDDSKNGTRLVCVGGDFVEAKSDSRGGIVTMGVTKETLLELMNEKTMPLIVLVDKEEYFKRNPK